MILEIFSVAVNNNCPVRYKDIHLKLVLLQFNCILGFLISYWYLWRKKNPLFFIVIFIFIFMFYFYVYVFVTVRIISRRSHARIKPPIVHFFHFFFFFGFLEWTESDKFSWSADTKVQRCQMKEKQNKKTFFVVDLFLYLFLELIIGWQSPWNVLVTNLSK
jgi:hypothetical protein